MQSSSQACKPITYRCVTFQLSFHDELAAPDTHLVSYAYKLPSDLANTAQARENWTHIVYIRPNEIDRVHRIAQAAHFEVLALSVSSVFTYTSCAHSLTLRVSASPFLVSTLLWRHVAICFNSTRPPDQRIALSLSTLNPRQR
mmetsp:Transcript_4176/g.10198  ORF Transcript_4176/g.10198 Transcript_4176/m.10198 type:complete len:143 (+) Transcript_4176:159-587(+)